MTSGSRATIALPLVVIPCFNEERRLNQTRLEALANGGAARLLFVDDGSTDGTAAVLAGLRDRCEAVEVLELPRNVGKAEAIRRGLLHGLDGGAEVLGYYDADLATPPEELERLLDHLAGDPDLCFVLAARVVMLGRRIHRRAPRHYLGRVFATMASLLLRIPVYDTQCGAKVFRASPALRAALERPWRSSWVFDVELIGRLLRGAPGVQPVPLGAFEEVPLREWRDVSGSRLGIASMARAFLDLLVIAYELNHPRRED